MQFLFFFFLSQLAPTKHIDSLCWSMLKVKGYWLSVREVCVEGGVGGVRWWCCWFCSLLLHSGLGFVSETWWNRPLDKWNEPVNFSRWDYLELIDSTPTALPAEDLKARKQATAQLGVQWSLCTMILHSVLHLYQVGRGMTPFFLEHSVLLILVAPFFFYPRQISFYLKKNLEMQTYNSSFKCNSQKCTLNEKKMLRISKK